MKSIGETIKELGLNAFATVRKVPQGGALQVRKLSGGAVMFYWRYTAGGKTDRVAIGTYDAKAPPKSLTATERGYSIEAAMRQSEQYAMVQTTNRDTGGYRATKMLDVVPAALGLWAEAERRCGQPDRALEIATEAAGLLEHGSPSLLNEAPIFLALHDACVDLGRAAEAKDAIARGLPRLVTRVHGLSGTPYARDFLRHLAPNAGLIAAAAAYGLLPAELSLIVARD